MILLHSKKAIYLRVRRTGSSSLAHVFRRYRQPGDVFGVPGKRKWFVGPRAHKKVHATAAEVIARYGRDLWDAYFTFAFIRNPWDRIVSRYFWLVQRYQRGTLQNDHFRDWYEQAENSSFEAWCESDFVGLGDYQHQLDYLTDESGDIVVKKVARFEQYESDAAEILERLGLPNEMPHLNRTEHGHYRKYYTDKSRLIVERRFQKDIDTFNYSF